MDAGFVDGRLLGAEERYRITDEKPLGQGADAVVYEAVDTRDGTAVAVKVIDRFEIDDDEGRKRQLERELNITRKLKHPNIINLLDVVFEDDWVLLIMELARGGSLFELATASPVTEERARVFFVQMLSALEYCHASQIFHRDLKLENVVFASPPEGELKITDFGVSKDAGINSMPKTNVGTIAYMAPEVTNVGRHDQAPTYDGAADLWSLGVMLFVMTTQRYPFGFDGARAHGGESAAVVYRRIRAGTFEVPETASAELSELLHGLLTTDPAARWSFERINACGWVGAMAEPYRPALSAPAVAGGGGEEEELRVPPRSRPRMRAASASYGSFTGSFLGFGSLGQRGADAAGLSLDLMSGDSGESGDRATAGARTEARPPSAGSEGDEADMMDRLEIGSSDDPLSIGSVGSLLSSHSMDGGQTPPTVRGSPRAAAMAVEGAGTAQGPPQYAAVALPEPEAAEEDGFQ